MRKLLVAGTHSGVGKTTITMGLIAALKEYGLRMQPFKAGPDYIDPTYHTLAAGQKCRNLDTWMVPPQRMLTLFHYATQHADIAIIEGVMGIFDGFGYTEDTGSSAEIAKLLDAPVLIVLDVGSMARSAGALAQGYANFDPQLNVAGFIANRCGSESHYRGVKTAIESATNLPVLGWLPKDTQLHIPERHLGLIPTDERGELSNFVAHAADLVKNYFDIPKIIDITATASSTPTAPKWQFPPLATHPTIAVAKDAAFNFYYEDNLDLLRAAGAKIVFFSPLTDSALPPNTAGIYLGGGFPELFAEPLSQNITLKRALQKAHAAQMPIYAECGGFMYLTEQLIDLKGNSYPMMALVPGITKMQNRLVSMGYRMVKSTGGNFLIEAETPLRGHEFHWSTWETTCEISAAWQVKSRRTDDSSKPNGYATDNLIASYIHLHFAHNLSLAQNFVQAAFRHTAHA